MDKIKVENLAEYFSNSSKQVVKSDLLVNALTSPAVALIAITVFMVVENDIGIEKLRWGILID